MMWRRATIWLVAVILPAAAAAQTVSVSGSVVDVSGGVVVGAMVTLAASSGERNTTTGQDGGYRFADVQDGTYQIAVSLSGFVPTTRQVVVAGANLTIEPLVCVVAGIGETVVVSASRNESALIDSPVSMTVIPAATIRAAPGQNYGDLLRSVPGLNVIQLSARDVNVTARQATTTLATSQLALLDGRSLYLDFYGVILWDSIPVDSGDIKQIEVLRGPASAVWGANALTGVVNIITRPPRESAGTTRLFVNGGWFDRNAGSTTGRGVAGNYGVGVSTSQAPNARWSYRVSAGYSNSAAYARPAGQIPIVADPRDPTGRATVGGAAYPADGAGEFGTAYRNVGSSQPKFDVRVDQEAGPARVTYAAGVGATNGIIYTGTGPFKIHSGSSMSYGRARYVRHAFQASAFTNLVDAKADNQLLIDPATAKPIALNFKTQTFDVQLDHAVARGRQALTYGASYRRNNFDVTLAPAARDRNEFGAYAQDTIGFGRLTLFLGARLDKFGNIPTAVFSPRVAALFKPSPAHAVRASFNRAFRSPSAINDYIDEQLVTPVDLRGLAPLLPPALQPLATSRFPLVVRAVGSQLPIGATVQPEMREESVTSYEWAYIGTFGGRATVGASVYLNDFDDQIHFIELPRDADAYTAANPPPNWALPAAVLTQMAQLGVYLPRTAFTYRNLGPTRQKGVELSIDSRLFAGLSASANYSWQDRPTVLEPPDALLTSRLTIPPTHRFNASVTYDGRRYVAAFTGNYSSRAFWSDVLTAPYHGYTPGYTLANLSAGVKWRAGRTMLLVKSNNVLNRTVQQHVFGDLLRRSVTTELRVEL